MRVSTAFNKILGIAGATVASVTFGPDGIVVGLRRRRAKLHCPCGWRTRAVYDRSTRRWRHLDLGATKLWLEAEIRRLDCRRCRRVRTEEVPWARPGARHTRDFQDVVAWLAQRTDKTTITRLLRISWEAVARIVTIVVADERDDARLEVLHELRRNRSVLYRCWQLKEGVRDLYRLADPDDAPAHLDWWLAWACRSRIPAFVALARTVRANRQRILAAVELGLSNSKLEGLSSKIRLINHRGYGHHSAAALIAMIYLCAGGITVTLPLR